MTICWNASEEMEKLLGPGDLLGHFKPLRQNAIWHIA
jgi:hypothetical protein